MTPQRVTIVDVATKAGVAISSVSAAVNGGPGISDRTRAHILETAASMGWVPSMRGRSLSGKRAFAVGLVVQRPSGVIETDPYFAGFIGGIEEVLEEHNQALMLQMSSGRERTIERYRRLAGERRVDGVFLSEIEQDDPRIPLLTELDLPAVAINPGHAGTPFPSVVQDHKRGIRQLVDHIVSMGHTRIAHVSGDPRAVHAEQREAAWREAVEAHGLVPGPVVGGDFTTAGGSRAAGELLALSEPPTAVFCANDLMAIGFIARASDLGLTVPDDVSVAGYDGIQLGAYTRPRLTTLQTSPRELGSAAARSLLLLIETGVARDVELEPASLVIRDSVARIS